jgi:sphingolipid 4-desaturase/C4-monooxygenase
VFTLTDAPDPHPLRHRMILAAHPEVTALYGRNPWTAAIVAGLVVAQIALAAMAAVLPWWGALMLAWGVGAWIAHALFASMHEAAHRLVFRSRVANRLVLVTANLPLIVPFAVPLAHWHLVHHRRQGQGEWDPDLPSPWEVRVFDRLGFAGRFAWHVLFPVLQLFRIAEPPPGDGLPLMRPWVVFNVLAQVVATAGLAVVLPLPSLVYLGASLAFVFALHPLAGRFVQEHHHALAPPDPGSNPIPAAHETGSYVGVANRIALNFGRHIEHHDFPAIPWNRLPRLREIAPEAYAHTVARRSWTWAWLEFLFDPRSSIGGRTVRPRVGSALAAERTGSLGPAEGVPAR